MRQVVLDLTAPDASARALKLSFPAVLLASLILVPFLDKAFTMDDTVFLLESRQALADPLHPTAFEMTWDHAPERVSRIVPTGPVMAWLLIPSILAGGSERLAHAMQLLMFSLAILATVSLSLRLGLSAQWAAAAGLILASMPAALGMAGTAMPDVPAMALGAAGMERLVAWRDERKAAHGVAASLLLGLAALARMHYVPLLGVAVLFLADDYLKRGARTRVPWPRWSPVAGAALVIAALTAITRDPAPGAGNIIATAMRYSSVERLASNTAAFTIHWVFAVGFAIPWIALRWRALERRPALFGLSTAAGSALLFGAHGVRAPFWLAPVAGLGAAALADVLMDAFRRRDGTQAALGLWLLLPLSAAPYVHLPSKLLLASAPAAAILLAGAMARRPTAGRAALAATVAFGACLGAAILRADAAFSGIAREAAAQLIAPAIAEGRRVWFVGHWGFQWYAAKAGARYLTSTRPYPAGGDRIVSSLNSVPGLDVARIAAFVPVRRMEDRRPGGRIMSRKTGSGFYANSWGYLPWTWGDDVIDAFELSIVALSTTAGRASNTPSRP